MRVQKTNGRLEAISTTYGRWGAAKQISPNLRARLYYVQRIRPGASSSLIEMMVEEHGELYMVCKTERSGRGKDEIANGGVPRFVCLHDVHVVNR